MDVGAFDELALHPGQILELAPHVGAEGVGAFRAVALADGNGIVAVILIDTRHGEMAVGHLHPLTHVDHLRAGTMLFQGIGKGAAVPQQLHVPIAGVTGGEFAKEGLLLSQSQALQHNLRQGRVHVALAADDIAHVREQGIGSAGHSTHHQLHGSPALRGNGGHVVLFKNFLIQQHESIHLVQHRLGQVVDLVHLAQLGNTFSQLVLPGLQNPVILVLNHGQIDRDDMDVELVHQVALVEDHGAEGLGTHTHLSNTHTLEVLHRAGHAHEPQEALGENRVFNAAVFDVSKGNVHSLQLTAHAEQAALGIGIPGAVRLKHGVLRTPQEHGLADGFGDRAGHFLIAEIAVDQEYRVHLLRPEALDNGVHVLVAVENIHGVDSLQIHEGNVLGSEMLLDIGYRCGAALLRLFPVKDTGAGRNVSANGNQADLDMIV